MSAKKRIIKGKGTPRSTPRPPSKPKPPETEPAAEGKLSESFSDVKADVDTREAASKIQTTLEGKRENQEDSYEGKQSKLSTPTSNRTSKKAVKKSTTKSKSKSRSSKAKIDEIRKQNRTSDNNPGVFMMDDDDDAEDEGRNIVGGSFLDIGARRTRNSLGVSDSKNNDKKKSKKKKKEKSKKQKTPISSSLKSSAPRTPEATVASKNDTGGDVLDGEADFNRPSVVLQSGSLSALKSRASAEGTDGSKARPHEAVYRSASSDEDESHNIVPIDMHDLMSSIRKAAPGAANYDSDNDENMGKTPSKNPQKE